MAGPAAFRSLLLAAIAGVALAGCGETDVSNCPAGVPLAPDASSMTVFRQGAPIDLSSVLYTVQIAEVKPGCAIDKKGHTVDSSLDIKFRATRAPIGEAVDYTVPYFVAVTGPDNKVIAKYPYSVQFSFAPGQAVAEFSDSVSSLDIDLANGQKAYAYTLFVGLQLNKQQLDYNRTLGHFAR